jgi:hypothetical protein
MSSTASPAEALPSHWVDQLFRKLSIRYGRQFMARWDGIDESEVKADWACVLGGFWAHPDCIAYALDNLPPDRPPTATQFRELCRAKPDSSQAPQLQAPKPDPQRVAAAMAPLAEVKAKAGPHNPRAWAHSLHAQIQAGRKVSPAIRAMVADVMRMEGRA